MKVELEVVEVIHSERENFQTGSAWTIATRMDRKGIYNRWIRNLFHCAVGPAEAQRVLDEGAAEKAFDGDGTFLEGNMVMVRCHRKTKRDGTGTYCVADILVAPSAADDAVEAL